MNLMPKLSSRTVSGPQQWNGMAFSGKAAETVPGRREGRARRPCSWSAGASWRGRCSHGLVGRGPLLGAPGRRREGGQAVRRRQGSDGFLDAKAFDSGVILLRYEPDG